jgi:biopolymer transport protein TolR
MRRISFVKSKRPTPSMNVTPLVDVVLVLLIIFMIVIPSMEHDAQVELPNVFHVDEEAEGHTDPVTVSIATDGRTFIEEEALEHDTLIARLAETHDRTPLRRVILRADRGTEYGTVRDLFAECRTIGFPGISLRVGERSETEETGN